MNRSLSSRNGARHRRRSTMFLLLEATVRIRAGEAARAAARSGTEQSERGSVTRSGVGTGRAGKRTGTWRTGTLL